MAGTTRKHDGGSIRRRGSGRWQVRVHDPATGKHVSIGTYATKSDANAALRQAGTAKDRGGWIPPERGQVTLATYATEWLDNHPSLAAKTRDLYRILLNKHVLPGLGGSPIGGITPATVERWYVLLGKSASPNTRAKAYRLLRTILNHAVKHEQIVRNPCRVDGGGIERTAERPVATIPQVLALADAFPARLSAIVLVAAFGSLRVGECAGLQRADVDPLRDVVHVRRQVQRLADKSIHVKDPKADSRRSVALPEQIMSTLTDHLDVHTPPAADSWVFTRPDGDPVDHLYIGRHWRQARKTVSASDRTLPDDLHFHDLRGTGATLATAQGASLKEVMSRLGHTSTRAALIYQHATSDRDAAIAGMLGQALTEASASVTDLDERRSGQM